VTPVGTESVNTHNQATAYYLPKDLIVAVGGTGPAKPQPKTILIGGQKYEDLSADVSNGNGGSYIAGNRAGGSHAQGGRPQLNALYGPKLPGVDEKLTSGNFIGPNSETRTTSIPETSTLYDLPGQYLRSVRLTLEGWGIKQDGTGRRAYLDWQPRVRDMHNRLMELDPKHRPNPDPKAPGYDSEFHTDWKVRTGGTGKNSKGEYYKGHEQEFQRLVTGYKEATETLRSSIEKITDSNKRADYLRVLEGDALKQWRDLQHVAPKGFDSTPPFGPGFFMDIPRSLQVIPTTVPDSEPKKIGAEG